MVKPSLRRNRALRLLHEEVIAGRKSSFSSANAYTLPLLLERLETAGVPYTLRAEPGLGYSVSRAESEAEEKPSDHDAA